jgi:sugar phosphate isomerase/epimerase
MTRRSFLTAAGAAALRGQEVRGRTQFQIGCLTLPYSAFPLERALEGIARAGCRYVGFGTRHQNRPILAVDAPASEAARLAERARKLGLAPLMMFSTVSVEAADSVPAHERRIEQAAAAGIPYLLTFGSTQPGQYDVWISNLKQLAPRAQGAGVTLLIKPHGGNTATGADCARILADVGSDALKICYDAGNVLDYQNVDPIADIHKCYRDVWAFTIKDHRNTPRDEDCGPGYGEIDHYKLLAPVAGSGREMPLLCENIFEPLVPRPKTPEEVDTLARRAREFLETVTRGIAAMP